LRFSPFANYFDRIVCGIFGYKIEIDIKLRGRISLINNTLSIPDANKLIAIVEDTTKVLRDNLTSTESI